MKPQESIKVESWNLKLNKSKQMNKESNPSANPSEQDVSPEEGKDDITPQGNDTSNDPEIDEIIQKLNIKQDPEEEGEKQNEPEKEVAKTLDLDLLKKVSGREFKSEDDFIKHYTNLNSLVGDNKIVEEREKAKKYDEIMRDAEQIEKAINEPEKTNEVKEVVKDDGSKKQFAEIKSTVDELRSEIKEKDFIMNHPEAQPVLDIIKTMSKATGKELEEVFVSTALKDLIADQKALGEIKKDDLGVKTKTRLTPTKSQIVGDLVKKLKEAEKTGRGRDVNETKQKMVELVLGDDLK